MAKSEGKFSKSTEAPYTSVKSFDRFFDAARVAKKPEKMDTAFLKLLGIESGTSLALLPALRFLGLMGDGDAPSEHYDLVYLVGSDFADALRARVEAAYSNLFERINVATATREQIEQYFRINFSPTLADRQARAFLGLCRSAGLTTDASDGAMPTRERSGPRVSPTKASGRETRSLRTKAERRGGHGSTHADPGNSAKDKEPLVAQYASALIRRVETTPSPEEARELMQRIEKLLGVSSSGEVNHV